jgi:lipopolysaccharide export system permease protein
LRARLYGQKNMKILTRYILQEHIAPFLFGLAAIVFVFMLNIVFRDLGRILGKGLPASVILEFFALNLAWILALAVPMAVLIAALMAFGRLSSDREIDAMKAGAIPVSRMVVPVFAAAGVLAVLMVVFNNTVLPDFNYRVKVLSWSISRTRPMMTLEPNVFYNGIPDYSILVQSVDQKNNRISGVFISDASDPRFTKTVVAERGTVEYIKAQERILFTLYNGEMHEVDTRNVEQYRRARFEKQSISISIPNMFQEPNAFQRRGDREKSTRMLMDDIRQDRQMMSGREAAIRSLVLADLLDLLPDGWTAVLGPGRIPRPDGISRSAVQRVQRMTDQTAGEAAMILGSRRSINSLWVEIHKKYSIPFACIVFVLIGAPLGILSRQSGFATAGWLSLVFFIIFWAFLIGGEQLADRRILHPAVAMWSADAVVGAFGVALFVRTLTESTLFPWGRLSRTVKKGSP